MPERIRLLVIAATTAVALAVVNVQIMAKERIVREGRVVLLELAPRDPRSLLQGDYMALRYRMADDVVRASIGKDLADGRVVLELDENGVASLVGVYEGEPLAADRQLLQFRRRGEVARFASDAFFFEEGQAQAYSRARFGELRVAGDGSAVLTGLRGASRAPLPARDP